MKKQLLLLVMMLLPMVASAYDAKIDGIYYDLNQDNKTAEVTYKNTRFNSYSGDIVIPSEITYNAKNGSVRKTPTAGLRRYPFNNTG